MSKRIGPKFPMEAPVAYHIQVLCAEACMSYLEDMKNSKDEYDKAYKAVEALLEDLCANEKAEDKLILTGPGQTQALLLFLEALKERTDGE